MVRPVSTPNREDAVRKIKSFIAAHKYGVPAANISEEFEHLEGAPLDLPRDCETLYDLIQEIPEIRTRRRNGELRYVLENSAKISHLTEMISKQKSFARKKDWRVVSREVGAENRRSQRKKQYEIHRELNSSDDSGKRSSAPSSKDSRGRPVKPITNPPPTNRQVVQTPLVSNRQLIGDDFFLQLAIRELKQPIWREWRNGPLHSGLCVSGQTVRDCIKALQEVEVMSNKLVIMLGAEDVYQGREASYIQDDYEELLELLTSKFAYSVGAITLCTVPPLGNISWLNQPTQFTALRALNYFIVNHAVSNGYQLADFFSHFSNVRGTPKYELFQVEPRRVSGTPYSYLLFGEQGRRLAMTLLNHVIDGGLHDCDTQY
ncbi:uncharacterized protein LOC107037596 [Diachasma alloeum]|uniref:uncharacterized protein LOC107037596 n=1 Tax=Diachasma alloeum TaxID=454923 RepID=UPI0007384AB5|nr:uncharacterized protein LOC107037596 [Diachasma alloeum]